MKYVLLIVGLLFIVLASRRLMSSSRVRHLTPEEAAKRVNAGTAILIDVREPSEWQSGVAEPAVLLPLSDLRGERLQWGSFLRKIHSEQKELILYCRSGHRSNLSARILHHEGFTVANAGSLHAWQKAGFPLRQAHQEKP